MLIGRETERTRGISTEACRTGLDRAVLVCEQPQQMSHTTESPFDVFSDIYIYIVYIYIYIYIYIYVTEESNVYILKSHVRSVYAGVWLKCIALLK